MTERGWGGPEVWSTVPEAMRELAQWGVWHYSPEGAKHPCSPRTGRGPVDAHSTANLRTFELAVEAAVELKRGLYFDLQESDPFAGVDLDGCVTDEESDEHELVDGLWIHREALAVVRELGGYCELSPSGTGLKVTLEGAIPSAVTPTPAPWGMLEMYDCGRFWTVTGRGVNLG